MGPDLVAIPTDEGMCRDLDNDQVCYDLTTWRALRSGRYQSLTAAEAEAEFRTWPAFDRARFLVLVAEIRPDEVGNFLARVVARSVDEGMS